MSGPIRRFRASWPAGDPYLLRREAGASRRSPTRRCSSDPRLQTLIAQALANNRDLMVAAANIAAAREQYRIQRANQLPTVDANGGVTASGDKDKQTSARNYQPGVSVPNFELDLFGRLRSLTKVAARALSSRPKRGRGRRG